MLDFNHMSSTPGLDVQQFNTPQTSNDQYQTWRKPRGVKNVYMIGVGGGSSGAVGTAGANSPGGAGGGSGAQSSLLIPAFFVPDILYIHCGLGGQQPATLVAAAVQVGGGYTSIAVEPSTSGAAAVQLLYAAGGTAGTAGGAVSTIATMPLAARGFYSFFVGQSGTAGGASQTNGTAITFPVTGLMVMGGAGGGGSGAAPGAGGGQTQPANWFGSDYFTPTITGGAAAAGATPAGTGAHGKITPFFLMNYGGAGGGGATTTAGGIAGAGGNGAPGSGGGGSGGQTTQNTTIPRPGNGGNGFVIIMSW